jgi:hypothetical protein
LPGAFAPVHINVRVGGDDYDELHVDGRLTRQVFIRPSIVHFVNNLGSRPIIRGARLHVVRNSRIALAGNL